MGGAYRGRSVQGRDVKHVTREKCFKSGQSPYCTYKNQTIVELMRIIELNNPWPSNCINCVCANVLQALWEKRISPSG